MDLENGLNSPEIVREESRRLSRELKDTLHSNPHFLNALEEAFWKADEITEEFSGENGVSFVMPSGIGYTVLVENCGEDDCHSYTVISTSSDTEGLVETNYGIRLATSYEEDNIPWLEVTRGHLSETGKRKPVEEILKNLDAVPEIESLITSLRVEEDQQT